MACGMFDRRRSIFNGDIAEGTGIMQKSLLYATDINPGVLDQVMKEFYPLRSLKQFSENYILSGGKEDFSSYYTAKYDVAKFDDEIEQ
jgi:chemotaxis protein methyltransferase CheR